MKIRLVIFLILMSTVANLLAADKLNMFIEIKRYFDENKKNTQYVIDYQVPYKNLQFKPRGKGFFAELKVDFTLMKADSVVYQKEFTNNIGVSQKYDLTAAGKFYLDRIALTLAKSGYRIVVDFEDLASQASYQWAYDTEPLNPESKLSDLELVKSIVPDTTIYAQKFKRDKVSFLPEVSGIIPKASQDTVFVFCERYDNSAEQNKAVLQVLKDSTLVMITSQPRVVGTTSKELVFPINVSDLTAGKYLAILELKTPEHAYSRDLEFFIAETPELYYAVFTDPEEEYQMIKDLGSVKASGDWKDMSRDAKRAYISNFWQNLAASQGLQVEDVVALYKKRVDYCNSRFSHFEKGWKTDMGRIYIRNGAPDDIDEDTGTDDTKFIRKDFQIWKYSGYNHPVYVFVDIPMNGNFKLVYAANDDKENTNPNWRKYLGTDFDETRLEN